MNKIYTFKNDVYHRDIGTIESYAMAQLYKNVLAKREIKGIE